MLGAFPNVHVLSSSHSDLWSGCEPQFIDEELGLQEWLGPRPRHGQGWPGPREQQLLGRGTLWLDCTHRSQDLE